MHENDKKYCKNGNHSPEHFYRNLSFVSIYFHKNFMLGNVKIKLYHVSERLTWLSDISRFKFNKNKSYIKWKSLGRINDLPEPSRGFTSIHYTFLAFRLLILEWLIKDSSEKKDFFKRLFLVLLFFSFL